MSIMDGFEREAPAKREGDYRAKISAVEETVSKTSGSPMLVVTVAPDGLTNFRGEQITIRIYIVKNERYNQNVTRLLDCFAIPDERARTIWGWTGFSGGVRLGEDDQGFLKVRRYLTREQFDKLPPWSGEEPHPQEITRNFADTSDDEDMPF